MAADIRIITSYPEFSSYLDDYALLLAEYFVWNIQSRYDYDPETFEKYARKRDTTRTKMLQEFLTMQQTSKMSAWQLRRLQSQFNQGQHSVLVYTNQQLVGMARLLRRNSLEGELHSVYVTPKYRHQYLGSLLLDSIIAEARESEFERVILATMPFMEAAIHLYESMGFERVEYIDIEQYSPEKAAEMGVIFMQLDLIT